MAFPPRPRSARTEPSFAPSSTARETVPMRQAAPRPAAIRPTAGEAQGDRDPVRFPAEPRRANEPRTPAVSAGDRLILSSDRAEGRDGGKRPGMLRAVLFAALLALAGIGAVTVYQWLGGPAVAFSLPRG